MLGILLACVLPVPASAATSIGLSAGSFKFNTTGGNTLNGDLYVSNEGETPVQVLVYTTDVRPNAKGTPEYVKPVAGIQPTSNSPASWTTIKVPDSTRIINNAPYLALAVGEQSHVFFTIKVPEKAPAGDYSEVIFFEMFNLGGGTGATSRIGGRLGSRIQVRVQGKLVENVSVRPFSVGSVAFTPTLPYSFAISNGGNLDHEFTSRLQLLDADEEARQTVQVGKSDYIYARSRKVFDGRVPLKGLGLGKYTAELTVSYMKETMGADGKVTRAKDEILKKREFYVVPYTLLIPVLVALLALILFLVTIPARRRRRERRGQAVAGVPPVGGQAPEGIEAASVAPAQPAPVTPSPEPTPEPVAEPTTESAMEPTPEPVAEPTTESAMEPTPEPAPEPTPEPAAEPGPERSFSEEEEESREMPETAEEAAETAEEAAPSREAPEKETILPKEERPKRRPSWGKSKYYGPGSEGDAQKNEDDSS